MASVAPSSSRFPPSLRFSDFSSSMTADYDWQGVMSNRYVALNCGTSTLCFKETIRPGNLMSIVEWESREALSQRCAGESGLM